MGRIGASLALAVLQDDDVALGVLAGQELRIARDAEHPEAALGVPAHRDGPLDERIRSEELDLEAVGDLEELPFHFRVVAHGIEGRILLQRSRFGARGNRGPGADQDQARDPQAQSIAKEATAGFRVRRHSSS